MSGADMPHWTDQGAFEWGGFWGHWRDIGVYWQACGSGWKLMATWPLDPEEVLENELGIWEASDDVLWQ